MRILVGKVVGGKVVYEGDSLPEGAVVTILAQDAENPLIMAAEDEAELLEAIAEMERGESVSWEAVLDRLRKFG